MPVAAVRPVAADEHATRTAAAVPPWTARSVRPVSTSETRSLATVVRCRAADRRSSRSRTRPTAPVARSVGIPWSASR